MDTRYIINSAIKSIVFAGTMLKADFVYLKQKVLMFNNTMTPRTSCFIKRHLKSSDFLKVHEILVQKVLGRFSYISLGLKKPDCFL